MQKITQGILHIFCSVNNTIVTLSQLNGDVVFTLTAGMCGFKGHRRSTTLAASTVSKKALAKVERLGVKHIAIKLNGIGIGRDYALDVFKSDNISVNSLTDVTPIPHNGTKPRKARK